MDEPKKPYWMPDAQGFTIASIILICAICVFYRMTHPSPTDDKLLDMMLTILFSSCLVAIVGYQFGSSRGSAAKDDTQNKIVERLTPPAAPLPPSPVTTTTTVTDASTVTKTEPTTEGQPHA